MSKEQNAERQDELASDIHSYICFQGEGAGEDPSWKPERSLLILGISRKEAFNLGIKYEKNAILTGRKNSGAELIMLV